MNEKIARYARTEGFCCLWAFLEANKHRLTSVIMADELTDENGKLICTERALQIARAKHRSGETQCKGLKECLRARIEAGKTIP